MSIHSTIYNIRHGYRSDTGPYSSTVIGPTLCITHAQFYKCAFATGQRSLGHNTSCLRFNMGNLSDLVFLQLFIRQIFVGSCVRAIIYPTFVRLVEYSSSGSTFMAFSLQFNCQIGTGLVFIK